MTQVARAVVVDRPVAEVWDDWTDTPALSRRLGEDIEVEPIADATTRWTLPLGASRHRIVVREIHTSSRREIVWLSLSGPRLAGRLSFRPLGARSTCVRLSVDFDPRNPVGWAADSLGVPDRAVERVLGRFKDSVEGGDGTERTGGVPGPAYEILDHPHPPDDVDLRGPAVRDASGSAV
jgi:uncharacterized membrane protein